MKATANLILDDRRAKKNGKYNLKVRVIYLRQKREYRTKYDLSAEEFNEASKTRPSKQYKDLSIELTTIKNRINEILEDLPVFTFEKFENSFYGNVKEASNVWPVFEDYIQRLKNERRVKTASSYQTALNSFKAFRPSLGFYDITAQFLKEYDLWMKAGGVIPKIKKGSETKTKKSNSSTTIGIYVRSLRAIYNYAIAPLGIIKKDDSYPFGKGKYTIPAGRNTKKALTIEEIGKISRYETIPGTPMDRAKDFWMFSYVCNGLNFKDIAMLKNENIDGKMLRFIREKTKLSTQGDQTEISCYLSPQANLIIAKWRISGGNRGDYLFGILSPEDNPDEQVRKVAQFIKNTNKYMKRISSELGLGKKVTTYFSRHSAATILKRSGNSVEVIREALGHHSTITTQKYLASFEDETKKQLADALTNFA